MFIFCIICLHCLFKLLLIPLHICLSVCMQVYKCVQSDTQVNVCVWSWRPKGKRGRWSVFIAHNYVYLLFCLFVWGRPLTGLESVTRYRPVSQWLPGICLYLVFTVEECAPPHQAFWTWIVGDRTQGLVLARWAYRLLSHLSNQLEHCLLYTKTITAPNKIKDANNDRKSISLYWQVSLNSELHI